MIVALPWNGNSRVATVESVKQGYTWREDTRTALHVGHAILFFISNLAKACSIAIVSVASVGAFAPDISQRRQLRWLASSEDQLQPHETTCMPSRTRTDPTS